MVMQITQILQIFHLTQKKSFNLTQISQISQISQKAMRHGYPHAEAQRTRSSHRDFIGPLAHSSPHPSKGRGPSKGGGVY